MTDTSHSPYLDRPLRSEAEVLRQRAAAKPPCAFAALQGALVALQECQTALIHRKTEAELAGSAAIAGYIQDVFGYLEDAQSDLRYEIDAIEDAENRAQNERDERDEAAYEQSVRSLKGKL